MKTKISFRMGITLVVALFLLLLAGLAGYNFERRFSEAMLDLSEQINDKSARHIIDTTRDYLGAPASYTTVVARYLENGGKQDTAVEHHEELWHLMWGPLLITPQLQSLFYADEAGSYVQVRRDPEFSTRLIDRDGGGSGPASELKVSRDEYFHRITERTEPTDYDPRKRDWYEGVNRKAPITWSGPFISATFKTPLIAASSPILDPDGGVRGVASVNIPCYGISQELSEMSLGAGSVLLVVDEEYRLIAHPLKSRLVDKDGERNPRVISMDELGAPYTDLHRLLDRAKKGESRLELRSQGIDYRVFVEPFRESFGKGGWRLLGLIPRPEPAVAEITFKDHAKQVFALLEKPAAEARQLAASFKRGREPLKLGAIHGALWEQMWKPLLELPHLQSFVIGDAQGTFVQARREPFLGTRLIDRRNTTAEPMERKIYRDEEYQLLSDRTAPAEFDPRHRPWYAKATQTRRVVWSEPHLSSSASLPVVSATLGVARPDGSKAGMVSANIPLYKVSDFVAQAKVTESGQTMILDSQGQVVAYPDKTQLLIDDANGAIRLRTAAELDDPNMKAAYRHFTANPEQERFLFTEGEGRFIGVVQRFPETIGQKDWTILSVMPEEDLSGRVRLVLLETAAISAAILLLAVVAVFLLATALSRPLGRLAGSILGFKDFRLDAVAGVESGFREVEQASRNLLQAREGLGAFEKYLPVELVRQLIQTRQAGRPGGKRANVALLFANLEVEAPAAESLPADALMEHISTYLERITQAIAEEQGVVDNFFGNAIMAFWGSPVETEHAPERACLAALRCLEAERQLNRQWKAEGKPLIRARFGIHCGPAIVGNIGTYRRLNFTVIGDAVELVSRLEGINKDYGTRIMASDEIYHRVKASFHLRLLDRVVLVGRKQGADIYELLATADGRLAPEVAHFRDRYHLGLKAYWRREWSRAGAMFQELAQEYPDDPSVRLFMKRCRRLQQQPEAVGQDWDGTYIFPTKPERRDEG